MRYVCSICGYVYDEEVEGTPFAALPDTWTCPLCGAAKSAFEPEQPHEAEPALQQARPVASSAARSADAGAETDLPEPADDLAQLSDGVIAAICSNLARGCEKQYLAEESALFSELAAYFIARADAAQHRPATSPEADADALAVLAARIQHDLDKGYPVLRDAAIAAGDRGTQRICVWGEKVTRALASLAERYRREGPALLEGTRIWVCSVCGFTFIGERPPALCPVCKVPDWKFDEIRGRA